MEEKQFKLSQDHIKRIIDFVGGCFASDTITVEGLPVGYMYREKPSFKEDSGWRFFSGTEDDEYINNVENLMIYDVNTIANYDNAIIPYLNCDVGTELERNNDNTFSVINVLK
jgi:hypothetical protein